MKRLRVFFLAALALTCNEPSTDSECSSLPFFGIPNEKTGLTSDQCKPSCACPENTWEAPTYGETDALKALSWTLTDPPAGLTANPYDGLDPTEDDPDTVCGVLPESQGSKNYALVTYASEEEARSAGAFPTHFGRCGLCSTLIDLAVYIRTPDLTAPVRQCGLDHLSGPSEAHIACLQALGFARPCAEIWYYNTLHTRSKCGLTCFGLLDAPYNNPDGSLNDCLACDEEKSGAVFKAVAGRTRRNTGIPSAICRPCSEARALVHDYL